MTGKQNYLEIKVEEAKYLGLYKLKAKFGPEHPLKACVTVEV